MTLKKRVMSEREKEIVWMIVLVSTQEAIATHHIDRLIKGGGKIENLLVWRFLLGQRVRSCIGSSGTGLHLAATSRYKLPCGAL